MDNLRLRRSIGIVTMEQYIDFFKSNTRESIILKMNNPQIVTLLQCFDGNTSIQQVCEKYQISNIAQLEKLLEYLHKEHILIHQDVPYPLDFVINKIRLLNLLEDYCHSTSEVMAKVKDLANKTVLIIGLGAVGSFIAMQLVQFGVSNLIFVDKDCVRVIYTDSIILKNK